MHRELPVQPPRTPRRTTQLVLDWAPDHLQSVSHAGQQAIQHLVAEVTPPGEKLADARLTDSADPRQLRLGDAAFQHHLTQDLPTAGHTTNIAGTTMTLPPAWLIVVEVVDGNAPT